MKKLCIEIDLDALKSETSSETDHAYKIAGALERSVDMLCTEGTVQGMVGSVETRMGVTIGKVWIEE
jgi:hypothetical protein